MKQLKNILSKSLLAVAAIIFICMPIAHNKQIKELEKKIEYQETVNQKLFNDIHKLSHKLDNSWMYEEKSISTDSSAMALMVK